MMKRLVLFPGVVLAFFVFAQVATHANNPVAQVPQPEILGSALRADIEQFNPLATVVDPNETTVCGSSHTVPTVAEQSVIDQTNQLRASRGVRALSVSPSLEKSADTHSLQMATTGLFAHDSYGATLARTQSCGSPTQSIDENIAGNGSGDPTATFQQYVNSPEHLANLLDPSMVSVGVSFEKGIYKDPQGTTWPDFWMNTMTFASTADTNTGPTPTPQPTPQPTPAPSQLTVQLSGPASGTVGQLVTFAVSGSGSRGTPYYLITFGDNSSSTWQTTAQFSHTYGATGAYAVTGYYYDTATGQYVTAQRSISVSTVQPTPTPQPSLAICTPAQRSVNGTIQAYPC